MHDDVGSPTVREQGFSGGAPARLHERYLEIVRSYNDPARGEYRNGFIQGKSHFLRTSLLRSHGNRAA